MPDHFKVVCFPISTSAARPIPPPFLKQALLKRSLLRVPLALETSDGLQNVVFYNLAQALEFTFPNWGPPAKLAVA